MRAALRAFARRARAGQPYGQDDAQRHQRGEGRHQQNAADLARHTRSLGMTRAPFRGCHAGRREVPGSARRGRPALGFRAWPSRSLVVKVTAGKDDPERCNQAFTVAATAVASGLDVSLWLTGEAAWFALPDRADDVRLPHSPPLGDLLASVLAGGHGDAVHPVRGPAGDHRGRRLDRDPDRRGGHVHRRESSPTGRRRWCTDRGRLSRSAGHGGEPLARAAAWPIPRPRLVQRRQRPGRPAEQQVGQARVARQRRAVQVGAEHAVPA